jgi:hypothetical protein
MKNRLSSTLSLKLLYPTFFVSGGGFTRSSNGAESTRRIDMYALRKLSIFYPSLREIFQVLRSLK